MVPVPQHTESHVPNQALERTAFCSTSELAFPLAVAQLQPLGPESLAWGASRASLFPFLSLLAHRFPFALPARFCSGHVARPVHLFPAAAPIVPPPVGCRFLFPQHSERHVPNQALERTAYSLSSELAFSPAVALLECVRPNAVK